MTKYIGWVVVDSYEDGLILESPDVQEDDSVLLKFALEVPVTIEEAMDGQMDIQEHLSSLDWVHARDVTYYHRNCGGSVHAVEAFDNGVRSTECGLCGMRIDSTLSHPSVTYRDNKARLA